MSDAVLRRGRSAGLDGPADGLAVDFRDRRPVAALSSPRKKKKSRKKPPAVKAKYTPVKWRQVKIEMYDEGEWKPAVIMDGTTDYFLPDNIFTVVIDGAKQVNVRRSSAMRIVHIARA